MTGADPVANALASRIAAGELAGAAAAAWRAGGPALTWCAGSRDIETGAPTTSDTLFRIASLTKPITSVLALMLMEDGRIALEDPIARWAPEFAEMRVLRDPEGPLGDASPAHRQITFEDLLTHRAGLTYGDFHAGPIAAAYAEALGGDIDSEVPPDAWIARLGALPLIDQPGALFHYGRSTDLLGLLIARMEGAPLGEVMQARIFEPLGMADTGFRVPLEKRDRRAGHHGFDAGGRLVKRSAVPGEAALPERPEGMAYESGGQGLWSTLDDYLTFARLFAEGGAVGGVRLLQPETVSLMTANRLTPQQRADSQMFGQRLFAAGHGFGLGVAVVVEPELADPIRCGGGTGSVGWPGAYGGWWQADPNDASVLIFLTHNMVELHQLMEGVGLGCYAAIGEFQRLATDALN
jgi:CubicO group peptidase (beta-lactamase class C family)